MIFFSKLVKIIKSTNKHGTKRYFFSRTDVTLNTDKQNPILSR